MKARLREEIGKYLVVSTYLYACFGALLLYESALLQQHGIEFAPWGTALAKALIVGKFLLIGEAMHIGQRMQARHLLYRISQRVLAMLLLLVLLTLAEEYIVALIHGRTMTEACGELASRSLPEYLAELLLMAVILTPLIAATELNRALGPGTLRRLLTSAEESPDGSGGTASEVRRGRE